MARKSAVLARKQRLALLGAKYVAAVERIRRRKEEPPPRRPTKRVLVLVTVTVIVGLYLVRKRMSGRRKDEGADYGAATPASAGATPVPTSDPESTGNAGPTEDSAASSAPSSP